MDEAFFGRMRLGRCVSRDFGYVGCSRSVLSILDQRCSGRPRCDLAVSDAEFVRTRPCPQDLTSFLEASHRCLPGLVIFDYPFVLMFAKIII